VLEQEGVVLLEPLEFGPTPLGVAAFTWVAAMPEHYVQLREVLGVRKRSVDAGASPSR